MVINHKFSAAWILFVGAFISLFLVWDALALSSKDIVFPAAELNNCKSESECRSYCDNRDHAGECLAFAKKHNLLPAAEIERFENLSKIKNGPGGCNSQKSCEAYCNDLSHIDGCLKFAIENGLMKGEELENARKVNEALKRGVKSPGGCRDRNSCETYCSDPLRAEECLAFGKEAGFISEQEARDAEKFLPLMKRGETPGGCKSRQQCEAYCEDEGNLNECISFAEKAGLVSKEELEIIKKTGGRGPGGCKSRQQCEAYCEDEGNLNECISFAEKAGLVSKEELEIIKKTGGRGPGDCRGRACKDFCKNPENQKACFEFAKEQGLLKEEDMRRMEEGRQFISRDLERAPPQVKECVSAVLGPGGLENLKPGEFFGGTDIGEKIRACFQQVVPEGFGKIGPGGEFSGPGGCKSFEECSAYCQANQEDETCKKFAPPGFKAELNCSPKGTSAKFICAINGKGARPGVETTYFNECTARQHDAEILHDGVCEGHAPCGNVADPVCGNDGNTWVGECYANEQGGGVKHAGACEFPGGPARRAPTFEGYQPPVGNYPMPDGQKIPEGFKPPEGFKVPEGFKPPEGFAPPSGGYPSPEDLQKYQQQFQQQFQQQIPPEYQQYLPR